MKENKNTLKIKVLIPKSKKKFYKQCNLPKDTFEAIKYYHYWKKNK
jgi:hypothetical protein